MVKTLTPVVLDRDEWLSIFDMANTRYPTGRRDKAAYYLCYYTGLRVGELCRLRFEQVDLKRGKFIVPRDGKTGERRLGIPKSPRLFHLLESWVEQRKDWAVDSPYFFCTKSGGKVNEKDFAHTLKRRAVRAGITKRVHPHGMRHSYAAERIREGLSPAELMHELGHSDLRTTTEYVRSLGSFTIAGMQERVIED